MRIFALFLCSLFSIVGSAADPAHTDNTQATDWSTDVSGVTEMQLSADYWLDRLENAGQVLKDQSGIEDFNKVLFSSDPNMVNLALFPEQLSGADVRDSILAISKPNSSELYNPGGEVLASEGYRKYTDKLGLENIPASVEVQYALVVSRADMRTYPTDDRYYKTGEDQNLDRFQENGLFPGDAVAMLHTSSDNEWSFVQSYNYSAWVRSSQIAIGERRAIEHYQNADRFLVITGDKVRTSFNPDYPALSELQLDMGIRIPLAGHDITGNSLYGQNPYASYAALLPLRDRQGRLEIRPALIARNKDVSRGYIPFTRENIIRQAFKFLGERYGWGHSYNARDCTGFVMEIYKTFGFLMPRNTGQQGSSAYGLNTRFTPGSSRQEKLQALKHLDIGDLIYVPGHVLMYIGDVDGEPYVIHDVSVFRYIDENGEYYEGTLNGVSVTPLIPLYGSRESPYVDLIYNIKRIR
jgi:cell wall-associated NlpC family hydrolase